MPAHPTPPSRPSAWDTAPVLLGLFALWLLATLGLRPLILPDEGRYAEVARAMSRGDTWAAWAVPTLDGLPFFHKPPLFYWLDAAAMRVFGPHEFAGRFGSAVGAWVMGAALYFALRRWHGQATARLGLGVLATTPFFFVGAQFANHDMLVAGLITAAVLAFARAVDTPPRVERRWLLAGWLACALALLSKGLIGLVLPALVIGPWLLAQRRWRQLLGLLHPLGLLVFAAVGLPWFIAMQQRYPGFFDYFVVEQHFRRYARSTFNNVQGAWFFLVALPLLTLPWSAWLPAALRRVFGAGAAPGPVPWLYAWWAVAIVGFFSIPSSKLVGYALPALAPWCALLTLGLAVASAGLRRWVMRGAAAACLAIVAVGVWKSPPAGREPGRVLAAGLAPGDRVAMLDRYDYDLPFHARLAAPVTILADWADPSIPRRDNWRKEVFDAARFDPALARMLLQPLAAVDTLACGAGAVWFVTGAGATQRVAGQPGAVRVHAGPRSELWRVPGRACP